MKVIQLKKKSLKLNRWVHLLCLFMANTRFQDLAVHVLLQVVILFNLRYVVFVDEG